MTSNHDEPIVFVASFPPILSAWKITGNGDGMRIQLDIPEDEMGNAARLLLMREQAFKVTIEAIDDRREAHSPTVNRSKAKKRK